MSRVVFRTPTLLDTEAFMVFGVSAKPNTNNPIGYFGTGLKYAIAVLLRENIRVTIWIGHHCYVFYKKEGSFRGQPFQQIMMKKRGILSSWTYHKLPFTLTLGKNWKLWQVLRELHSNTLDENGTTFATSDDVMPEEGYTKIIVEGDLFTEEFHKIDNIFLPDAHSSDTPWTGHPKVEIRNSPSQHIYYRGLRVLDLRPEERANLTYNILCPIELTEDRTVKYGFYAQRAICDALAQSEDRDVLTVYAKSAEDTYEGKLDWDWSTVPMSPLLVQILATYRQGGHRGFSYSGRYTVSVPVRTWVDELSDAIEEGDKDSAWRILQLYKTDIIARLKL